MALVVHACEKLPRQVKWSKHMDKSYKSLTLIKLLQRRGAKITSECPSYIRTICDWAIIVFPTTTNFKDDRDVKTFVTRETDWQQHGTEQLVTQYAISFCCGTNYVGQQYICFRNITSLLGLGVGGGGVKCRNIIFWPAVFYTSSNWRVLKKSAQVQSL